MVHPGEVIRIEELGRALRRGVLVRQSRKPSQEVWRDVERVRELIRNNKDDSGGVLIDCESIAREVFRRYSKKPPASSEKLGAALHEECIGVALAELCIMNPKAEMSDIEAAMEKLLDDIGLRGYLLALHKGHPLPSVRVPYAKFEDEFVTQVREGLLEKLTGVEWACRKVREEAGEVAWKDVEQLLGEMGMAPLMQDPGFYPWYNKLNRNKNVPVLELLSRWLAAEVVNITEEAQRYSELLERVRKLGCQDSLITRSQCQSMTKDFDHRFKEGSQLRQLGELINTLFSNWASDEGDKAPYLNLLMAWISTRKQSGDVPSGDLGANFV